jgi:pimeloyl-ACP methyl ester carboxylesterase
MEDPIGTTAAERSPFAVKSGALPVEYVPRRGYADWQYGQIHFRDTGSAAPGAASTEGARPLPVIMCHQSPQTSKQFTNVYGPLHRRGVRAIGIDTPGFGESDPCPFVPAIEDWAAAVLAVLDHLGIPKAHTWATTPGVCLRRRSRCATPGGSKSWC